MSASLDQSHCDRELQQFSENKTLMRIKCGTMEYYAYILEPKTNNNGEVKIKWESARYEECIPVRNILNPVESFTRDERNRKPPDRLIEQKYYPLQRKPVIKEEEVEVEVEVVEEGEENEEDQNSSKDDNNCDDELPSKRKSKPKARHQKRKRQYCRSNFLKQNPPKKSTLKTRNEKDPDDLSSSSSTLDISEQWDDENEDEDVKKEHHDSDNDDELSSEKKLKPKSGCQQSKKKNCRSMFFRQNQPKTSTKKFMNKNDTDDVSYSSSSLDASEQDGDAFDDNTVHYSIDNEDSSRSSSQQKKKKPSALLLSNNKSKHPKPPKVISVVKTDIEEEHSWQTAAILADNGKGIPLKYVDLEDKGDMTELYKELNVVGVGQKARLKRYITNLQS